MLPRWLASLTGRHDPYEEVAAKLYARAVAQAREPAFYSRCGVPDTVDGRFDSIALHVWMILRRLRDQNEAASRLAQAIFDIFMGDMDLSLREMGAGDLGVGKRVKAMAQALMGRAQAYDLGLDKIDDDSVLSDALGRNLYRGVPVEVVARAAPVVAAYVRREMTALEGRPLDQIMAGSVDFGTPTGTSV